MSSTRKKSSVALILKSLGWLRSGDGTGKLSVPGRPTLDNSGARACVLVWVVGEFSFANLFSFLSPSL